MVYLVDFENVGNDGLCGIESLQADDKLVIFVSANSNKVNVLGLAQCKAPIYFVYSMVNGCHDYMDFQIATACGMYASNNEDVCIISNDNGYSAVADFCKYNKLFEDCGTLFLQRNLQGKTKKNVSDKYLSHKRINEMQRQSAPRFGGTYFKREKPPVSDTCEAPAVEEKASLPEEEEAVTEKTKLPAPEKQFIERETAPKRKSFAERETERRAEIERSLTILQSNRQTALTDGQIEHLKSFIYDGNMSKKRRRERIKEVVGKRKYSQVWNVLAKHFPK